MIYLTTLQIKYVSNIISKFETNQTLTLSILSSLIIIFTVIVYHNVLEPESFTDHDDIKNNIQNCSFSYSSASLRLFILCEGNTVFHNEKILPLFYSISLLVVSYLLANKITNHKIIGIITVLVIMTAYDFQRFAVSSTYDNLWALTLLVSIYLIYKKPYSALPFFIISILCKPLTLIYTPMILFMIYNDPRIKHKPILLSSYLSIPIFFICAWQIHIADFIGITITWKPESFLTGGIIWIALFLKDPIIISSIIPTIIALVSMKNNKQAMTILIFILGIILSIPFLEGFTDMSNMPYRFSPLFTFLGIAIGMIFYKLILKTITYKQKSELSSN